MPIYRNNPSKVSVFFRLYWPLLSLIPFFALISLGRVARWDLLDQIAAIDRVLAGMDFYPPIGEEAFQAGSVSIYFPGVALLGMVAEKAMPNAMLVYFLHGVAILVVLLFLWLLARITFELFPDVPKQKVIYILLAFSTLVCGRYYDYALEFKPDSIAFLIGMFSVWACTKLKSESFVGLIGAAFLGCIAGSAIVFKQQYVLLILGVLLYSLFTKNLLFLVFSIFLVFVAAIWLLSLNLIPGFWHWTVRVISDDGFLSVTDVLGDHKRLIPILLVFLVLSNLECVKAYVKRVDGAYLLNFYSMYAGVRRHILKTPWPLVLGFSAAGSIAGAMKVGGNSGNTCLGLMLFFPLLFVVLKSISKKILLLFLIVGALNLLKESASGAYRYSETKTFLGAVNELKIPSSARVLAGSNHYIAARGLKLNVPVSNHWTIALQDDSSLVKALEKALSRNEFDYLFFQNSRELKQFVTSTGFYDIVFVNKIGAIAVRKSAL